MWPWCNLAASQRRPYCAFVNSHSPMGLVSRQWDTVDWACVIVWPHSKWPSEQISFITTMLLPILQLSCRLLFGKVSHHTGLSAILRPRFVSLLLLAFPKAKIPGEREEICECEGHTIHKLSQWRLTADGLAPRDSDCSQMHSKVSPDWLPSYIKSTLPVLERSPLTGCQVTWRQHYQFSKGLLWLTAKLHQVNTTSSRKVSSDWLPSYIKSTLPVLERSPLTGCQVTSREHYQFSRYSKLTDNFGTTLVFDFLHILLFLFGHLFYIQLYLARNFISACLFFVVVSRHSDFSKSIPFFPQVRHRFIKQCLKSL